MKQGDIFSLQSVGGLEVVGTGKRGEGTSLYSGDD